MNETPHLVERVPEAIHRLLTEILTESAARNLSGEASVHVIRATTLHERDKVRADLTITLELNCSNK